MHWYVLHLYMYICVFQMSVYMCVLAFNYTTLLLGLPLDLTLKNSLSFSSTQILRILHIAMKWRQYARSKNVLHEQYLYVHMSSQYLLHLNQHCVELKNVNSFSVYFWLSTISCFFKKPPQRRWILQILKEQKKIYKRYTKDVK